MKYIVLPQSAFAVLLRLLLTILVSIMFTLNLGNNFALATGVYDLPALSAGSPPWVIDTADVLSRSNESQLNNKFRQTLEKTGKEIRIVVIRRLDFGETINSFADALFEQWYPTPEAQSNQVLLALDTLTNHVALLRGDAVKPIVTDAIANSIVTETVAYALRDGSKYNQAALEAGDRLATVLSGQPDLGPPQAQTINIESTYASAEETQESNATLWIVVFLVLATLIPMVTYFWYVGFPGR
jgi:uncharacterized protein